ncbi:hypothetical protein GCM10010168_25140 [Actinoplanes ianthinogenes]|uniref:Uncharacterized protein n=1 Tax=Actinoplanes ianthinogenes TaxID=122358 RepID=A0ABM7M933_9ACTN|nr:hypothetical protein [Actinoplanes ianthinogenes]BCJ48154.1 hypothetical protein Aiant_88110 [Actinoplanes ianthinogenes]GGR06818.1 hypothetical protein GCM10010168_25140 [Actinoplanes ianthinogenes]
MLSRTTGLLLAGGALVAVAGGLLGSPVATAGGCLVVFVVLALHPEVRGASPVFRVLLWSGLALFAAAVVVHVSAWTDPAGLGVAELSARFQDPVGLDTAELVARFRDPAWQRAQFQRHLLVAACLTLGFGALAGAGVYLSRRRLRALPVPVAVTLLALFLLVLLPLFGSFTNVAMAAGVLAGGYLWVMRREFRRDGAIPIVAAGVTVLAVLAWQAADTASRNRPEPVEPGVFYSVAVAIDTGPDVASAVAVGLLLLAAAGTVLACAQLARDSAS